MLAECSCPFIIFRVCVCVCESCFWWAHRCSAPPPALWCRWGYRWWWWWWWGSRMGARLLAGRGGSGNPPSLSKELIFTDSLARQLWTEQRSAGEESRSWVGSLFLPACPPAIAPIVDLRDSRTADPASVAAFFFFFSSPPPFLSLDPPAQSGLIHTSDCFVRCICCLFCSAWMSQQCWYEIIWLVSY